MCLKIKLFAYALSLLIGTSGLLAAPITYEEIIAFEKPLKAEFSPTGAQIAFLTKKGILEENRNKETLYSLNRDTNQKEKVFESEKILAMCWDLKKEGYYLLCQDSGVYSIFHVTSESTDCLMQSSDSIAKMALSRDGERLFYTRVELEPQEAEKKRLEKGWVYDWKTDHPLKIYQNKARNVQKETVWSLPTSGGESTLLTTLPSAHWYDWLGSRVEALEVSPAGDALLFSATRLGDVEKGEFPFTRDMLIWDCKQQAWQIPFDGLEIKKTLTHSIWIDENTLVAYSETLSEETPPPLWLWDRLTGTASHLEWTPIEKTVHQLYWDPIEKMLYAFATNQIYLLDFKRQRVEQIPLPILTLEHSNSPIDPRTQNLTFIHESSTQPPEIALYDFKHKEMTRLTDINPQIKKWDLGQIEKIDFTTPKGVHSVGYLVHPVGEMPGKQYPLIVATYAFSGGFLTDAEWHSTFPVQTLAGKGYAVLLLNRPSDMSQSMLGDAEEARKQLGWDCLELFEYAVEQLVQRGLVNPNQVGIYGWSHGGFIVNFLITHSNTFQVAASGEGGDYNPGEFWYGGHTWTKIFDNTFGGPPWGDTLKAYLSFCPLFNIEKVRSPLLLEYSSAGLYGVEMLVALRYLGAAAELVIYPEEEHNFVKPKARIASMKRKVDWFDYWFGFSKDSKAEWETMRKEAIERQRLHPALMTGRAE